MTRSQPTGPDASARRRGFRRAALALASALVATLVGCGTGPGGIGPDTTPPSLSVSGLDDGSTVEAGQVVAMATSSDDRSVPRVTWSTDGGDAGTCTRASGDDYACGPISLVPGANTVTFTAEDAAGNRASVDVDVTYAPPADTDLTPPSLSLSGVADGETRAGGEIAFTAYASDAGGVASVAWSTEHDDAGACTPAGGDAYACGPVPLPPGATAIAVEALDQAGNRRTVTVTIHRDVTPPTLDVSGITDGATVTTAQVSAIVTSVDDRSFPTVTWSTDAGDAGPCPWIGSDDHDCGPIPLAEGDTTITFRAEDAVGNATTASYRVTYAPNAGPSGFEIEIVFFDESFTPSQRAAFQAAADRWESIVVGDLEDFLLDQPEGGSCNVGEPAYTGTVDDLLIFATSFTDAPGGLLGSAGPCLSRSSGADAGTNAVGFMRFDTEDLDVLEANGDLVETIVHEMGHVLGIGTNWEWTFHDLLDYEPDDGAPDCRTASGYTVPPTYIGAEGIDAWHDLGGSGTVPVEDGGGLGTRCGHWDEETFDHELMTGFLNSGTVNPLSQLTVRSLQDIGLTVDVAEADPYTLPTGATLRTQAGFDIAAAEILFPARGTIDPATGEIDIFPGR